MKVGRDGGNECGEVESGGEGKECGLKLTSQCCSYDRVTAIFIPGCVDCRDSNSIVGAWDEVRQCDHLSTH